MKKTGAGTKQTSPATLGMEAQLERFRIHSDLNSPLGLTM